jgi:DNA-binding response OmpR family regulator
MSRGPDPGRQPDPGPGAGRFTRRPPIVLFVDPDRQGVGPLAAALARASDVSVVGSAREALAAVELRMPDLIVTELDLPDAAGVDLIAHIHRTPATHHVLLLVLTGRRSTRDKIAAFQAGADDYLVKPVDPREFALHVQLVSRFQQVIGRG